MGQTARQHEAPLFCQRCHGLLIDDHFIDLGVQESGKHLWIRTQRCINCGNVVAPPFAPAGRPKPTIIRRAKRKRRLID
jgi:hypothetical protein